jgi:succinate dehydrogenase hydrophobic anchor subunit
VTPRQSAYRAASIGMLAVVLACVWLRYVEHAALFSTPVLAVFGIGLVCAFTIHQTYPDDDPEDSTP